MGNFSFKNFGFTPFMNEMREILKPELPYVHSKLLKVCALFGCSHISGYIKLSLSMRACITDSKVKFLVGHLTQSTILVTGVLFPDK